MTPEQNVAVTALIDVRRTELARMRLADLIGESPEDPTAWLLLARAHLADEDWAPAAAAASQAIGLDPDAEQAHRVLSAALGELGDHTGSVDAAAEAVRLRPDYWLPHLALAAALRAGRRPDLARALESARTAVRLEPTRAAAYTALGMIQRERHRPLAARRAFRAAGRLDPLDPNTMNNLAAIRLGHGSATTAARLLAGGLAIDPQHDQLLANLDVLWMRLARRLVLTLLALSTVQSILMIPASDGLGSPTPVLVRTTVAVVALGLLTAATWPVLRRLPSGVRRPLPGLWSRLRARHRFFLVLAGALLVLAAWQALAPGHWALQTRQRTTTPLDLAFVVLLVLTVRDAMVQGRRPKAYADSGRR